MNPIQKLGLYLFLVTAIATTTVSAEDTSLWDMIPGMAQLKSVFQLIAADPSGAAKTQINFLQEGLVSSQLRSAYYLITGEPGKASDVQRKFLSNLEGLVDALPLIGHVKGGIHLLAGDQDRGWNALKSATSTTGTILGAAVLGPIGAVGGHLLTDSAITVGDYALNGNKFHPHGVLEYFANLGKKDAGEHFDALASLALDCWGGRKVKAKVKAKDSFMAADSESKISVSRAEPETKVPLEIFEYDDAQSLMGSLTKSSENVELHEKTPIRAISAPELREIRPYALDELPIYNELLTTMHYTDNADKAMKFDASIKNDPNYAKFNLDKRFRSELEKQSFKELNSYANELALNELNMNELRNHLNYLTEDEKSLLTKDDFRTINTEMIKVDSTLSALAGIAGKDVSTLQTLLNRKPDGPYHPTLDYLPTSHFKELVKRKYIRYLTSYEINGLTKLNEFIANNKERLEGKTCILTERSGIDEFYAYVLKVKTIKGYPGYSKVFIDYSTPGFLDTGVPNPYRITSFVKSTGSSFRLYAVDMVKSANFVNL